LKKWVVKIDASVEAQLRHAIAEGYLTAEDQALIVSWVEEIQEEGIESILNSKFWNDHALDGKWFGYRSSSFSRLGRIIYKVKDEVVQVVVVRITSEHDYT
jgi:mRNA-degrading endonuclease YafQ of YafQ-DinJ toxin-antitoxin module